MKAIIAPSRKDKERLRDDLAEYYSKWMELNWLITFVTVCKFCGLGKERANRLFDEIRAEMARHNDYGDYKYSMKELQAEIERLGIPFMMYTSGQGGYYDQMQRQKYDAKNQAAGVAEAREMAEKLRIMKELM